MTRSRPDSSTKALTTTAARKPEARRAAFHALELMRGRGLSLTEAARRAGTTPASVVAHVRPALAKRDRKWIALPADRLHRSMVLLTEGGVEQQVAVRGSRVASLIGGHWSAIGHYLDTGDATRLERFRGTRAAGYLLEADLDAIDLWQRRGDLNVEDIYSLTS